MPQVRSAIALGFLVGLLSPSAFAESRSGTGFAIANGTLLITNNHVISGCVDLTLPGFSGAKIVRTDPKADIAILKPSQPLETSLSFRSGQQVRLGEEVIVIGYPLRGVLSSPPTVTTGIVSSLAGMHDDRTRMQISAPVQPGNSGGPVLDKAGNVVGVVVSKLDAIRAAEITGDIPQNVNFAIQSSIVTSVLDSYSLSYNAKTSETEMPVEKVVAGSIAAIVPVECSVETTQAPSAAATPVPAPPQSSGLTSSVLCGRETSYVLDKTPSNEMFGRFVGVWTGLWNNANRLCGALVVQKVDADGSAEGFYIYGPTVPGTKLTWKRQHVTGVIHSDGKLFFRDDQGSAFLFEMENQHTLNALFGGGTGRLRADFERIF